jgi:MFS family permease
MTSQAIAQPHPGATSAKQAGLTTHFSALAGLLAVPGFLQLCISSGLTQSFGQRMQGIAVGWLVLEMTGSEFWLGVVNGAPAISIVLFSLVGGLIADRFEARKVLLLSRAALALTSAATALLVTTGGVQLTHLVVYMLIVVGIAAVDMPVARGLMHDAVGGSRLLGATAAQQVFMNTVSIAAPVAIGLLVGTAGSGSAFWVLGAGYSLAALLVLRGRSTPVAREAPPTRPLSELAAGLAYILRTPIVAALIALAFLVPVAGVYFALVPVYARDVLGVGATGLGVLAASFAAGSLLGSAYLAVQGSMRHRGKKLTLVGVAFGLGMMAFALSQSFLLSCAISLVMGVLAGFWQNTLSATVQIAAAPALRGRVLGVFTMAFQLMGLGWLAAGLLASCFGSEATVFAGGAVFAGASVAVFTLTRQLREID